MCSCSITERRTGSTNHKRKQDTDELEGSGISYISISGIKWVNGRQNQLHSQHSIREARIYSEIKGEDHIDIIEVEWIIDNNVCVYFIFINLHKQAWSFAIIINLNAI